VPPRVVARPRHPSGCVPLPALGVGAEGRVCLHECAGEIPPRLADLGFVAGTPVRVVRRAPLGDPLEVEIRGARICLRRADLDGVCATPLDPSAQ
jgi:ferrous iron transport protein A